MANHLVSWTPYPGRRVRSEKGQNGAIKSKGHRAGLNMVKFKSDTYLEAWRARGIFDTIPRVIKLVCLLGSI